jgi:predicted solute-binding protein
VTIPPVRLGSVNYLNAQPLIYRLGAGDDARFTVRRDPPAECARLLAQGDIDLGLIPAIAYHDRPLDRIVPDVAIASRGPVASVAIFTRMPIRQVRTIALDTSSRTSVALVRIMCRRTFHITPTFARHLPDLPAMLRQSDAALVIGDPALFADLDAVASAVGAPEGITKIDLGALWTDMTGLPFVWAFWAGRPEAASPAIVAALQATRDAGLAVSDALADAYVSASPHHRDVARQYLRAHIQYGLSGDYLTGLQTYYREAHEAGVIDSVPEPTFFAAVAG